MQLFYQVFYVSKEGFSSVVFVGFLKRAQSIAGLGATRRPSCSIEI